MFDSGSFFDTFLADINSLEVTWVNSVFKLTMSIALGMTVGYERKRKGQIAGIRTFALMSLGACLAMILSIYVPQAYLSTFYIDYDYDRETTVVSFVVLIPTKGNLLPVMEQMRSIEPTRSITLSSQTDI